MATNVPLYGIATAKQDIVIPCPAPPEKCQRLQAYMARYVDIIQQLRSTMDDKRAIERLQLLKTEMCQVNNL